MRTSLLVLVLLSGCVQGVDVGSEFSQLTTAGRDGGGAVTRPDNPQRGFDASPGPDSCWGGLSISDLNQWQAFQARGCETFEGTLEIVANLGMELPATLTDTTLTTLAGTLRIYGATGAASVTFQELRTANTIEIWTNDTLEIVNLPNLSSTNSFQLSGSLRLTELHAPALTYSGRVEIWQNPRLTVLDLPSLISVPDRVFIKTNSSLRQCIADGILAGLQTAPARSEAIDNGGTPNICP